jgi:hypothetical protein
MCTISHRWQWVSIKLWSGPLETLFMV